MATDLERLIVTFEARTQGFNRSIARLNRDVTTRMNAMERSIVGTTKRVQDRANQNFSAMARDIDRTLQGTVRGVLLGSTALAGALSVNAIRRYADEWTLAGNRLRAVGVETAALAGRQEELYRLAQQTRSSFGATVDLYARLRLATRDLGTSEADLQRVVETVNKVLVASGRSAAEANAALVQLGQALGSGRLQGDELRSLLENAPELAQAIADEFGVVIGQLKELGEAGALTSDRVIKAILAIGEQVDRTFAKTEVTTGQALTNLENAFLRYVGQIDDSIGASKAFTGLLSTLADNVDVASAAVLGLATAMGAAGLATAATRAAAAVRLLTAAMIANPFLAVGAAVAALIGLMIGLSGETDRATESQRRMREALDALNGGLADLEAPTKTRLGLLRAQSREALTAAKAELELARAAKQAAAARFEEAIQAKDFIGGDVVEAQMAEADAEDRIAEARRVAAEIEGRIAELDGMLRQANGAVEVPSVGTSVGGGRAKTTRSRGRSVEDELVRIAEQTQATLDLAAAALQGEHAVARLRAEQSLLAAAQRDGVTVTPALTQEIRDLAEAQATAETIYRSTEERLRDAADLLEENRTAEERLTEVLDRQRQLLPYLVAQIRAQAAARGEAISRAEAQRRAEEELADAQERVKVEAEQAGRAGTDAVESLSRGLVDAIRNADSFGDALGRIADRLADLAINEAFDAIFRGGQVAGGTSGGGIGGLFGGLFGGGGSAGAGSGALASLFGSFGGFFAAGGDPPVGRPSIVGEEGPEVFVPRRPGTIVSNAELRRALAGASGAGAGPAQIQATFAPQISVQAPQGASLAEVERMLAARMDQARRAWSADLARNWGAYNRRYAALRG